MFVWFFFNIYNFNFGGLISQCFIAKQINKIKSARCLIINNKQGTYIVNTTGIFNINIDPCVFLIKIINGFH